MQSSGSATFIPTSTRPLSGPDHRNIPCDARNAVTPDFSISFRDGEFDLAWNRTATITPLVQSELVYFLADLAAGGVFQVRHLNPSAHLLYLGLEGNASVQGSLILPGHIQVRSTGTPLAIRSRLGARGIAVLIEKEKIRIGRSVARGRHCGSSLDVIPISLAPGNGSLPTRLLRDCLADIAFQLAGGQDPRQLERAGVLMRILLKEAVAEEVSSGGTMKGGSIPWYVAAAEQELLRRASDPLSVTDLARTTGVSPRTLHDGFRKHRGVSPMKMLRMKRMQMVRKELTKPDDSTNVTDAALKWGFNHLGRFSAYYVAQFGERPSETLRLSRTRR